MSRTKCYKVLVHMCCWRCWRQSRCCPERRQRRSCIQSTISNCTVVSNSWRLGQEKLSYIVVYTSKYTQKHKWTSDIKTHCKKYTVNDALHSTSICKTYRLTTRISTGGQRLHDVTLTLNPPSHLQHSNKRQHVNSAQFEYTPHGLSNLCTKDR